MEAGEASHQQVVNRLSLTTLLLLLSSTLFGTVFGGRVSDRNGLPVPFATIYVYEISSGVSADDKGEFRISLSKGKYTCEVSSLGYKRERFTLEVANENIFREIVMQEEVYQLNDAYFSSKGENRANSVMRKAIARAPFHREQVKSYESSVYLKGTMKITKIPAILKIQAGKARSNLVLNKLFLLESHSLISYQYPGSYDEKVMAFSSTIPSEIKIDNISGVMRTSIYDKEFFGNLSPLATNAFRYYSFIYEGISNESGRVVNKIRVIPKGGDSKLFRGHIYIVDDIWSVSYIDFTSKETGVTMNISVNFNEVKPLVLMPTSYAMDVGINLMGVNAQGRFNSSVTFSRVNEGKPSRDKGAELSQDSLKNSIGKISQSQTQKRATKQIKTPQRLEIKKDTNIKREIDTLARLRDTTYWAEVRRLPLREDEILSYKQADSLKGEFKRVFEEDSLKRVNRSTGNKILDRLLFKNRFKAGKNLTLGYSGLSGVIGDFNFVDGYQIGQELFAKYEFTKNSAITITPALYYSSHREELLWSINLSATYSPLKLGNISLSMGESSADISNNSSVSPFVNSYASYFFGLNPVKYQSRRWVEVKNSIELATGLRFNASLAWHQNSPLENANITSLFRQTPSPNIPDNIYGATSQSNTSLFYTASLIYTPNYYYRVVEGRKRYVRTKYPTFSVFTRASLPSSWSSTSKYGMVGASVSQRFKSGLYSSIYYSVEAGGVYNRSRLFLSDYKHFRSSNIMVTENGFLSSSLLMDNYKFSTPQSWLTAVCEYNTDYLILNRLPFLNSQLLYEALHLKTVWLPERDVIHTEAGYSFGLKQIIRAGVFVGFDGSKYSGTAFRLEIPILTEINR